jgi:hypothetical protein
VSREAWSAMFMIFGLVDGGFLMTINGAPADSPPEASLATPATASAAPWRQVAQFLAGAAQLITIPARVSPDRLRVLSGTRRWRRRALGRAGFARKKVWADVLPSRIQ